MKAAAKRARKRHVQQELFRRGGRRKGAGRKPNGARAGSRHQQRPEIKSRYPLHVVMRVVPAVGNMRRRAMYKAMREATIAAALRERFRIVHISLHRTHVHMIVEGGDQGSACARHAGLPDLGGEEYQYGAQRQVRSAAWQGICGSLSRGSHQVANPRSTSAALRINRPVVPWTTADVSSVGSRAAG